MACVWFELSFAAKPEAFPELINAVDMRMKLGQWKLADTLYRRLLRMELTKEERDAVYRHLGEAISLMDGIIATLPPPPPPNTPPSRAKANPGSQGARAAAEAELSILLAAPAMFERAQSKRRLGRVEEEPSDDPGREWELIEGDQDVNAMLKDVRGRIDEYFVKNARNEPTMADFGAEGTLYVQLISATGLVAADSNGLSDPYCKLDLGGQRQRSRKLYETLDPVWHNEIFTFAGVLGQVVNEPLKVSVWDFDLSSVDDMLGEAEIELADHAYCNGIRREIISSLEPQGEVRIQVWWEPEGEEDRLKQGGQRRGGRGPNKAPSFMARLKAFLLERVIPEKFQTLRGCCGVICFPVLHPESRFCSTWNVVLAFFILYCALAVPLEIAFESDMVRAFCTRPEDPFGPQIYRQECNSFQLWFWLNFLVDVWFMIDITINFRTGYMHEGHFVNDDWPVMKAYLTGAFGLDVAGTIPLGIIQMLTNPDNPFGDEQITQMKMAADEAAGGTGGDSAQSARMLRLMRMAKLTKLARMRKLAKVLESFEEYLNPSVLAVFKLVFILLFCCHLFGCLWWMISDLEIAEELDGASSYSWMNTPYYAIESSGKNEWHPPHWLKNEASVTMKYMHAFFWGAGMITSLGERHVNPVTVVELIVTCAIMFFALMLNAFVISSLNQALASMNAKAELTGKQIAAIKSYLTIKQVPKVLRGRILEYYHYVLGSSAALEDMNLFESMPAALTTQLSLTTNKRLALSCTFFHKVSNEALVSLLRGFEAAVFIPAQRVAKQGMALKNVYFINRGIVKISTHDGTERTISNNENCGLDDYWTGSISNERPQCSGTADAITYCDIMCLEVKLMDKALERDKAYLRNVKEARRAAAAAQAAAKVAAMRRKSSQGGKKGPKVKSKKVPSSWFGSGSGAGTKGAFPTLKTLIKLKKHREANLPEPMLPPKHPRGSYDEILAMSRDLAQVLREMDKQTPPMVHYKLREVCGNDVGAAPSALKIRRREDGADEDYVAEAAASAREMSTCDSARSRPGKVSARSVSMRDSGGIALSDRKSGTSFPGGGGGGSASGSLTTPGPTDGVVQRLFEVPTSEAQRPPVGVAAAPNSLDVIC
ncbi:potassium voltage-gated channel subfamily h member 7 [Chrysochromulina tobinii]|uniref:Potassium voltage-gated channel subfamily h member 7 n=1 Tax=Chrysochromulina tobinii TaxID=1460289 RepID=A0A0M0JEX0_9EUKA|nr:potassium voltage-gated channel subfamily h member 7 [Chrysochromulina tobinii]|eukprot:KOO25141.1 potassium voltage-gated channel subfamily h member 7 [Chrysochromulina sp. CCMP291]